MDIEQYYRQRQTFSEQQPKFRELCVACMQPQFSCYCQHIRKFSTTTKFVILIHPIERKRRIATGRMSHLCLENSELIEGENFSQNPRVNKIVANHRSVVLYPGTNSMNLSQNSQSQKPEVIFVIDGTWATAGKMIRRSENLIHLPRICFTPDTPSTFRVRQQPHINCYSTIEAIHKVIDLMEPNNRDHDNLLYVFDQMVEKQIDCIKQHEAIRRHSRHHRWTV